MDETCRVKPRRISSGLAVGVGIAAGWSFLLGLYLGLN